MSDEARLTPPRWLVVALLALIVGCAAYLRVEGLDRDSVWHDEAHSAQMARRSSIAAIRSSALEDNNPPLYYLVLRWWTRAVGDDREVSLRMPSALLGILGVIAIFGTAQHL